MSYLEKLLETIEDAEARLQLNGLASKVPGINEWIVDPAARKRADDFAQWAKDEWDDEHEMTRTEWQQLQKIQALESRLGEGMNLDELNTHLGRFMTEKNLVTKESFDATIREREAAFSQELNLVSTLATRIPYLNARHAKDFDGELFDPDTFVKEANEKGYARYGKEGLDKYYEEFTAARRQAKSEKDIEARIETAKKEAVEKALQERAMGEGGQMPTAEGSPVVGHFQSRLMGLKKDNASAVPENAELGRGQIARAAAQAGDQAELSGRVQ